MDLQLGLFDDAPAAVPRAVGGVRPSAHHRRIAQRLPAGLRLGTSSWTFPGWAGIVYDRPVSRPVLIRDGLAAYATHPLLRTVGLDRTYYRPLPAGELRDMADAVPDDFRFLVKADRMLTSPVHPDPFGVRGPNPRFLDTGWAEHEVVAPMMEGLGPRAGPLLLQFPPVAPSLAGGTSRFLERLHRFLDGLPRGPQYAVELRTPEFLTHEYVQVLEATGTAHCFNVHPVMASLERQLSLLQPYQQPVLVVRWMLHAGIGYEAARERYEPFDRIVDADEVSLERITHAIFDALLAERGAYVVASNKAEGSAPLSVLRLAERVAGGDGGPTLNG